MRQPSTQPRVQLGLPLPYLCFPNLLGTHTHTASNHREEEEGRKSSKDNAFVL